MNISAFDLNHARALHFLLEEAHVGRAAARLGITPAAASNALRRLRVELGDALLRKKGRGLVRSQVGEHLRGPAREVIASVERLLAMASPFSPATFDGDLPVSMSEHVATMLVPSLDRAVRARAPNATLCVSSIPQDPSAWLEASGGILVGPSGAFAATSEGDGLLAEPFYEDRYVCAIRHGHPFEARRWSAAIFAAERHVLVAARGRTKRSDGDEQLEARGLSRRIGRVVPSFTLALSLVRSSDRIVTLPERYARIMPKHGLTVREVPVRLRPLAMKLVVHPAHAMDARLRFMKELLRDAVRSLRDASSISPPAHEARMARPRRPANGEE